MSPVPTQFILFNHPFTLSILLGMTPTQWDPHIDAFRTELRICRRGIDNLNTLKRILPADGT